MNNKITNCTEQESIEQKESREIIDIKQENKYKVYLAILNDGWLRRELIYSILPKMLFTKGVKTIWENPDLTWANPISSNRNKIVKRFLQTDCTHLLMIDNDVVPYHNPVELVFANRDIIGSPAKVRSNGQLLCWVAYVKHPSGQGYSAVNLDEVETSADIVEVDIVGTGCILIKREVLEKLKAPFHSQFDENGIQTYGTDFAFCIKAKENGFHIFSTTHRRCEHYKITGLNEMDSWDRVSNFDHSNSPYKMAWGEYSITQKDWYFVKNIIEGIKKEANKEKLNILEFGSGLSSLLMSEDNSVESFETDKNYVSEIYSKMLNRNDLCIKIWNGKEFTEQIPELSKYDLCFVDGPLGDYQGFGRRYSIELAPQFADNIIIHDAGREAELFFQDKYLRKCDFIIQDQSGDHISRCVFWQKKKNIIINLI